MITVHRGTTRTVLLAGRWVIKVPRIARDGGRLWSFIRGVQANLSERDHSDRPGVCPVLWSLSGLVNVYPRCQPAPTDLTPADYDAIGFAGPTDPRPGNVGVLGGQLVWIDYDLSWSDCIACRRHGFTS
ncbi:hypothetical protein [Amycolatopsis thermoflava]|uniref:hypothetical protein n=1 Tax=Amycolatopsis thermoflava TaxID=84480 RepID=UPI003F4A1008